MPALPRLKPSPGGGGDTLKQHEHAKKEGGAEGGKGPEALWTQWTLSQTCECSSACSEKALWRCMRCNDMLTTLCTAVFLVVR